MTIEKNEQKKGNMSFPSLAQIVYFPVLPSFSSSLSTKSLYFLTSYSRLQRALYPYDCKPSAVTILVSISTSLLLVHLPLTFTLLVIPLRHPLPFPTPFILRFLSPSLFCLSHRTPGITVGSHLLLCRYSTFALPWVPGHHSFFFFFLLPVYYHATRISLFMTKQWKGSVFHVLSLVPPPLFSPGQVGPRVKKPSFSFYCPSPSICELMDVRTICHFITSLFSFPPPFHPTMMTVLWGSWWLIILHKIPKAPDQSRATSRRHTSVDDSEFWGTTYQNGCGCHSHLVIDFCLASFFFSVRLWTAYDNWDLQTMHGGGSLVASSLLVDCSLCYSFSSPLLTSFGWTRIRDRAFFFVSTLVN